MTLIDSALLNLTERSCRAFQRLTGRTNVWLAIQLTNLSIVVYFVWAVVYSWGGDIAPRWLIWLFCGGLLYLLSQTVFKVPIETYENAAYGRVAKGFRNPRRVRDVLLRISFLTLSLALYYPISLVYVNLHLTAVLLAYCLIILTTLVLYLLACDPLPPCPGKLKVWLRGAVPSVAAGQSTVDSRQSIVVSRQSQSEVDSRLTNGLTTDDWRLTTEEWQERSPRVRCPGLLRVQVSDASRPCGPRFAWRGVR